MLSPRYFFLFVIVSCCCLSSLAQQQKKGTRNQNMGNYHTEQHSLNGLYLKDTVQIDSMLNYISMLTQTDPDSAQELLSDMLNDCRSLRYNKGTAAVLSNMARISNIRGDNESALAYYRMAKPYAELGFRNKALLAMFYNCISAPFYNLSQFDSMYFYISKAERLINGYVPRTLSDVLNLEGVYNNIGALWAGVGNYDKTLYYFNKSLAINMGYPESRKRLDPDAGLLHANIGMIYIQKNDFEAAEKYLKKGEELLPRNAITQMGLGELRANTGDHKGAEKHFRKAIATAQQSQHYADLISSSTRLGIALFRQNDHEQARSVLAEVIAHSRNLGNIDMENTGQAYRTLASIAAAAGDHEQAYAYEQESTKLLDSMKLKDKLLALYALESEIRATENEKSSADQRLQISRSRYRFNLLLVASGAGIVIAMGLFRTIHSNQKNKQRIQKNELDKLKQDNEIRALQAMIKGEEKERSRLAREIHDGIMVQFATIKMKMKSMPEIYETANAPTFFNSDYYRQIVDQMEDATRDLRHTAHNLMPDLLLQGGLEAAITYFCSMVRKNTSIEVVFQKVGNINLLSKEFELNVYRIMQELLQNAIKHSGATRILVQVALLSETQFSLTVEDNGIGFDTLRPSKGIGMFSIANRLQVLNGNMDVYSEQGKGTSISIEFEGNFKEDENDKNSYS